MMAFTVAAKFLIETALATLAFAIWQYVTDSDQMLTGGPFANLAVALGYVVLGTIFTGYLLFLAALGAVCGFVASLEARAGTSSIYLLCGASVTYIGVGLFVAGLDEGTMPIALGLLAGNAVFLSRHLVRQRRLHLS